jgi:nitrile hydratase
VSGEHHHPEPESFASIRTKAIESLLVEKGLISTDAIDLIVQAYEQDIGPMNGAKVVARAWVDPDYKRRLIENGTEAIAEMGFWGSQGAEIVVLENTPAVQIWSSARYVPATPGRYSAYHPPGTSPPRTGPAS